MPIHTTGEIMKKIMIILMGLMIAAMSAYAAQLVGESDGNDRKYCFYDDGSSVSVPLGGYCPGFK